MLCQCCGKDVAPATEWRHRTGNAPVSLTASAMADNRQVSFSGSTRAVKRRRTTHLQGDPLHAPDEESSGAARVTEGELGGIGAPEGDNITGVSLNSRASEP